MFVFVFVCVCVCVCVCVFICVKCTDVFKLTTDTHYSVATGLVFT